MHQKVLKAVLENLEENEPCALVTIDSSTGSTPAKQGLMMCVAQNGKSVGTIGGGALEFCVKKQSIEAIQNNQSVCFKHDLSKEGELHMICGGEVSGFINVFSPNKKLVIFGAGHVAQKIAKVFEILSFDVYVVDEREEFRDDPCFAKIKQYVSCQPKDILDHISFDKNTYVVVTTPKHDLDFEAASTVINQQCNYLGMIGSKAKVLQIKQRLEQNHPESLEKIKNIFAPIGLDIADNTPEEIAVAIVAQILQIKNKNSTTKN